MTKRSTLKLLITFPAIIFFGLFFKNKSYFISLNKNLIKKQENLHWIISETDL
jgi:hypothetical protein